MLTTQVHPWPVEVHGDCVTATRSPFGQATLTPDSVHSGFSTSVTFNDLEEEDHSARNGDGTIGGESGISLKMAS
jgi:hypothetical protein